jgi:septal ring factor EnvC (AmiA/AmiB activator)
MSWNLLEPMRHVCLLTYSLVSTCRSLEQQLQDQSTAQQKHKAESAAAAEKLAKQLADESAARTAAAEALQQSEATAKDLKQQLREVNHLRCLRNTRTQTTWLECNDAA